jgi:hypothetical protein
LGRRLDRSRSFAHLTEWEQMFLSWYRKARQGEQPAVHAHGFKWNQPPELNRAIWRKHHGEPAERVLARFKASYDEVLSVAREISSQELLGLPLGTSAPVLRSRWLVPRERDRSHDLL